MVKEYTCIVCPRGCHLTAEKVVENGTETIKVEGNFCPRGVKDATEEMTCPMRTVTKVSPRYWKRPESLK